MGGVYRTKKGKVQGRKATSKVHGRTPLVNYFKKNI